MKTYAFDFVNKNRIIVFPTRKQAEDSDPIFVLACDIEDLSNIAIDISTIVSYYNNLSTIPVKSFRDRKTATARLFDLAIAKATPFREDDSVSRNSTKRNEAPSYVENDEAVSKTTTEAVGGDEASGDATTSADVPPPVSDAPASVEAPSDIEAATSAPTNDDLKAVAVAEAKKLAADALTKAVDAATRATEAEAARVTAQAAIADTVKAATLAVAEATTLRATADAAAHVVNVEMTPAPEFAPKVKRAVSATRAAGASPGRRGRTAASAGKVLVLRDGVKTNPRREGSRAYKTFEILLNAADAGERLNFETYIVRGGHLVDLARDIKEEYVSAVAA